MRRAHPPRIATSRRRVIRAGVYTRAEESRLTESATRADRLRSIVLPSHHPDSVRQCENHQASNAVVRRRHCAEGPMRRTTYPESAHTANTTEPPSNNATAHDALPNRLMTAFEVAQFIGCHEETVRRAYLRGLLASQRFGVRGRRFRPEDVLDWLRRGAPTRVS